uniref:Immunoglobulin V-set domain-containing protein n=1 Tax=Apteryx owenii TaxID=8824 RepID=A0A8B9QDD2_APTOW
MDLPFLLWCDTASSLAGCRALTGPAEASGPVGGTVSVSCAYKPELAEAEKYWCRGSGWFYCSILVQTAAAEDEASGDRVWLRDDRAQHVFVVTMENLTVGDGDTYWCGIQQPWYDLMVPPHAGLTRFHLQFPQLPGTRRGRGTRTARYRGMEGADRHLSPWLHREGAAARPLRPRHAASPAGPRRLGASGRSPKHLRKHQAGARLARG